MIINHRYRFIFIKTEKTASTSMEIALSKFASKDDIITAISPQDEALRRKLGYRGFQNTEVPFTKYSRIDWARFVLAFKRRRFYNHMPSSEVKKLVGDQIWNSYYKFAFDRNPWDKAVSFYYWKKSRGQFDGSLNDFILSGRSGYVKGFDLYTMGGKVVVDDVFKYENIAESFSIIADKVGLPEVPDLNRIKAKGKLRKNADYRSVLSEEAKALISIHSAREIKLLGYNF